MSRPSSLGGFGILASPLLATVSLCGCTETPNDMAPPSAADPNPKPRSVAPPLAAPAIKPMPAPR